MNNDYYKNKNQGYKSRNSPQSRQSPHREGGRPNQRFILKKCRGKKESEKYN